MNNHNVQHRMLRLSCTVLAVLALLMAVSPAHAQQRSTPFYAHSLKWYMQHTYWRLGAGRVIYMGGSSEASFVNPGPKALLAISKGPVADSGAGLNRHNNTIAGELGFILPFWGEHLSIEAAIAPPLKVKFQARGSLATLPIAPTALNNQPGQPPGDSLGTSVPAIGQTIGTLHALPPNFTIVYRPWLHTLIRPYIGIGMVWLFTYSPTITAGTLTTNPNTGQRLPPQQQSHLILTRPIGCVGQVGFDIRLPWAFYLTADARYLGCATVHAHLQNVHVYSKNLSPSLGAVKVGTVAIDAHFKALLVQLSIGTTFWGG